MADSADIPTAAGDGLRREFGVNLAELRRRLGRTQADIGELAGRTKNNAISRLERGRATAVSFDVLAALVALAESSGHSAQWLFTGRDALRTTQCPFEKWLATHGDKAS